MAPILSPPKSTHGAPMARTIMAPPWRSPWLAAHLESPITARRCVPWGCHMVLESSPVAAPRHKAEHRAHVRLLGQMRTSFMLPHAP